MKQRNYNLDVIRTVAVLFVLAVHTFLNLNFYDDTINNIPMALASVVRTILMSCVPLFMLLTGYLNNKKEPSKKYYLGILKPMGIYILSAIAILWLVPSKTHIMDRIFQAIYTVNFGYSWYMGMYFGLFLLIPFLNLAWNGLSSQKHKRMLIITLFVLVSLPALTGNLFALIGQNTTTDDYWVSLYPILYYYLGAYIKEYGFTLPKGKSLVLYLGTLTFVSIVNILQSYGKCFVWDHSAKYSGYGIVILSVLLFGMLLNTKTERTPKLIKAIVTKTSELSLGIYLLSYISDKWLYTIFKPMLPTDWTKYLYAPLFFIGTFIAAFVLSAIIHAIYKGINALIKHILQPQK